MRLIERFLKYVQFDTQSDDNSNACPSTQGQMVFARYLKDELEAIGMQDIVLDDNGYLYATLPSNTEKDVPVIGFIAHMDTSPDCSGANVHPRIVESYDGGDIVLSEADGIVTSPQYFPELKEHVGEDLIVTDGHTLLGADDKAGVAEIVEAMAYLTEHPEIKHGKIRIGFNPDEELGRGAHLFNVAHFGCDWAYTMDGGEIGELEFENFNAASAKITIKGLSVHPGYAKNKMRNAALLAAEFISMMPKGQTPQETEGYEGFYHLTDLQGTVEHASISFIIRDHDRIKFEDRKATVCQIAEKMKAHYGECVVTVELRDQYYNMREKVEPMMHIIDIASEAMEKAGVTCKIKAIRGGTDGAQLSFMGLPCPNIFAGGLNFHGPHEFVSVQSMDKAMRTIVQIAALTAERAE